MITVHTCEQPHTSSAHLQNQENSQLSDGLTTPKTRAQLNICCRATMHANPFVHKTHTVGSTHTARPTHNHDARCHPTSTHQ
jgi:hypothetical protein